MKDINELKQKRGTIIAAMRALTNKADAEKRQLTAEENDQFSRMEADDEALRVEIEREERQRKREADAGRIDNPTPMGGAGDDGGRQGGTEEMRAFRKLLLDGPRGLLDPERRALQMDSATGGGFWIMPQQFSESLIQAVDDQLFIAGLATIETVITAASLGVASLDTDPDDGTWTSEIKTGAEDSSMAFGKRELFPHPLAKRIKVSNKLLRASSNRVEALVRERLSYKIALTEEKAFLTGTGAQQPLGVFIASANGISTGRDVSTGNSSSAIGADGLIEAKYSLKSQYQMSQGLRWIFHRTAVKNIRKLKDGDGQYLWRPGIQGDTGDTILGVPFLMSEHAPSTFTTGLYVGLIGDFRLYTIARALNISIQVLSELYAETNQTGYIVRAEVDGQPMLEEAFARVKLA